MYFFWFWLFFFSSYFQYICCTFFVTHNFAFERLSFLLLLLGRKFFFHVFVRAMINLWVLFFHFWFFFVNALYFDFFFSQSKQRKNTKISENFAVIWIEWMMKYVDLLLNHIYFGCKTMEYDWPLTSLYTKWNVFFVCANCLIDDVILNNSLWHTHFLSVFNKFFAIVQVDSAQF